MSKPCGRCKGSGQVPKKQYRGILYRNYDTCPICRGSGTDPRWTEKSCMGSGCWNKIEYRFDWDKSKVPDYCPSCRAKMKAERESSRHQHTTSSYQQRSHSSSDDKWREKTCPGLKGGSYCGNTIKYRTDWDHIPDICPSCREKAKAQKAQRDAEFLTGRCENCGGETRYHKSKRAPKLCKKCFDQREANKRTKPCQHCGKEVVYYIGEKEYNFCRDCNNIRVYVDRQGNTLQAKKGKDGQALFTFGRCQAPRDDRHGGDADRRREWASRGYYWVTMGGNPHETFIIDQNPVVDGFIQQRQHIDTSYSTASLRDGWKAMAIAVLGLND